MRLLAWAAGLISAAVIACASAHPAPAPAPAAPANQTEDDDDAGPDEPAQNASAPPVVVDMPERTRAPSTASYEQALSTPEPLNVNDDRMHLTDGQLTGPVRGVLSGCGVPARARITIKTVVQNGRAIGVTVTVRFDKPKSAKPPSKAAAKKEAKAATKLVACVDRAVRQIVWVPSRRRDSFTTEL